MQCCTLNRKFWLIVVFACCSTVQADFDEATKAYLLGNYEKARYEALVAAADGNPAAQMLLGQLYFNGEGVEKDIQMALYWYDKAASQGFSDAQYRLGVLYFEGKKDIPKDYNKAYQWLSLALENGNQDAKQKLEGLFRMDSGKVVNLHESPEVLQQVAATGNQQARYLLAEKLLTGTGVEQDKAKAINLLKEDAKKGFVKAQKRLGELYYYGNGLEQDYYEAYAWSMAYAGTNELGGLIREGKQIARSALRKLAGDRHNDAYVKSQQYFNEFVLPFHKNARVVGPDDYRIVVRSRQAQLKQAIAKSKQSEKQDQKTAKPAAIEKEKQESAGKKQPQSTVGSKGASETGSMPHTSAETKSESSDKEVETKKQAVTPSATDVQNGSKTGQSEVTTEQKTANDQEPPLNTELADGQTGSAATEQVASTPDDSKTLQSAENINAPTTAGASSPRDVAESAVGVAASAATKPASVSQPSNADQTVDTSSTNAASVKRRYRDAYNVLIREKSRMQLLFQNARDQDQARPGRIVFDMVISSAGKITEINVVSSELEAPLLEDALLDHLKTVDFGRKTGAEPFKMSFPVDFQP